MSATAAFRICAVQVGRARALIRQHIATPPVRREVALTQLSFIEAMRQILARLHEAPLGT
jgi:hypothetical protein